MNDTATSLLPEQYGQASQYLQSALQTRPLSVDGEEKPQLLADANITVSKGFTYMNWKDNASQDALQITVTSPQLVNSAIADAVGITMSAMLNEHAAMRDAAILVSPKEYLDQQKREVGELMEKARQAGIPGSDMDYTKMGLLNPDVSRNQLQKYGTQIIDGPGSTSIRVNIPTNPENRDAAAALAKKVVEDLTNRLPEIKEQMIKRIKRKKYIAETLTPKQDKHLQDHEFKVSTQQQGNWTSVFIDTRSPEQQEAQKNPGHTKDPEALKKTNMLMQIADEKSRFKIASRAIMFQGEELRQQASFFLDVAGTEDIKNGLEKIMERLKEKSGNDVKAKIDSLMKENFLKSPEQWNLPQDKQEEFKRVFSAQIDPDHPDIMKFTLPVAKGKADEIVGKIAALQSQSITTADQQPVAPELTQQTIAAAEPVMTGTATTQVGAVQQPGQIKPDLAKLLGNINIAGLGLGGN